MQGMQAHLLEVHVPEASLVPSLLSGICILPRHCSTCNQPAQTVCAQKHGHIMHVCYEPGNGGLFIDGAGGVTVLPCLQGC